MKKLTLILTFIVLLITILAIGVSADGNNVAIGATTSVNYPRWSIDPSKIVDGDRSTGSASNQSYSDMDYYIELDNEYTISELIVVVNGIGTYPTDGSFTWNSPSDNAFWFEVRTYDAQGNQTFKQGANHSTRDQNENYEVIFDLNEVKVKKITIYIVQAYNNKCGIWEVEAYQHICEFNTLKETLSQETCIEAGKGIYQCECGKTEEKEIPATGVHNYIDIDGFTYENGFTVKGIKTLGCSTCDDYITEELLPIFKFLGYSVSRSGKSICTSYVVEKDTLKEYEKINQTTLSYGIICAVTENTQPLNSDGSVASGINGQSKSLYDTTYPRFDIKISANDWTNIKDTPLVMCAYIIDGEKVSYICTETNLENASPISYNQINLMPI